MRPLLAFVLLTLACAGPTQSTRSTRGDERTAASATADTAPAVAETTAGGPCAISNEPDRLKNCGPVTLVQNDDGSLEARRPREGESIVGLVGDSVEIPTNSQIARPSSTEAPAALATYAPPGFDALGHLSASDTAVLDQYKHWSDAEPHPPTTVSALNGWMREFADWMLALPADQNLNRPGLAAAVNGVSAEHLFSAAITLMPDQVAKADFAPAWKKQMWNAAVPWLARAQQHYSACIATKESSLARFCEARLRALRELKGTDSE